MREKTLNGGALYYVILLILMISVITGFILLIEYFDSKTIFMTDKIHQVRRQVNSTLLMNIYSTTNIQPQIISKPTDDDSTIKYSSYPWGSLDIHFAQGSVRGYSYSKCALVGYNISPQYKVALFMIGGSRGISLSGSSRIFGDCYLPGKSIRAGSIEGRPFTGSTLVLGDIKESPMQLPVISGRLLTFQNDIFSYIGEDAILIEPNEYIEESFDNSFYNSTILFYSSNSILIEECELSGNIVIHSETEIVISSTCSTQDIVLIAPRIIINNGFQGSFQAFASECIQVGNYCKLVYPTLLCTSEEGDTNSSKSEITIGSDTQVHGAVILSKGNTNSLTIGNYSKVFGQIYCDGGITLKGDIIGSLFCRSFNLSTTKATYVNHLLDNIIDYPSLSKYYSGFGLFNNDNQREVIKWLD